MPKLIIDQGEWKKIKKKEEIDLKKQELELVRWIRRKEKGK